MKKLILFLTLSLFMGLPSTAQIIILNENMFQGRMSKIKAAVVDSLTNEPIPFASVYLIPSKDTTITNFTLSDAQGAAKLDEVPYGSYVFHVEMMGYKPYAKERYFREETVDLGTIRMKPDSRFLKAAVISDVGNPITVKGDTVEFNAASFHVGTNAMLRDLIKRMPGMEITPEGKVKFNGEEIDRLTVGGRTFFIGDQKTALNNLPAAIVDKIRVIDSESENTKATGIQDGKREKVLDVALKKEYQTGFFGNVGLQAGPAIKGGDNGGMSGNDNLVYNTNSLMAAYNKKDQLTIIANSQNYNDTGIVMFTIEGDESASMPSGLSKASQVGMNLNTSRIKDVDATVSVNYKYSDTDSRTRSYRTTFQEGDDLVSSSEDSGTGYVNSSTASMEFNKSKGKFRFNIRPILKYSRTDEMSSRSSEMSSADRFMNSSSGSSREINTTRNATLNSQVSFHDLWGKKKRNISVNFQTLYKDKDGSSNEISVLTSTAGSEQRRLSYISDGNYSQAGAGLNFSEPFGKKTTLSAQASFNATRSDNTSDAFDDEGRNEYYSSVSRRKTISQDYQLTGQYKFSGKTWFTLGCKLSGMLQETYSRSFGIEDTIGKDDWNWFVTPNMRFNIQRGNNTFNISTFGYTTAPDASSLKPVVNVTDPSRLKIGNVFLKPYSNTFIDITWRSNNPKTHSNANVYAFSRIITHPVNSAQWYDSDGIMYSIPVNARKPSVQTSVGAYYSTPLDSKKIWSLSLGGSFSYNTSVNYQTATNLDGLNTDEFDYTSFIASFWGDKNGDRFYGGESGFRESRTQSLVPGASASLKFNGKNYSFRTTARSRGHIARYSINSRANLNTLDNSITAEGSYTTKHEFELQSDISYTFYHGYPTGYGQSELNWNAEVNKSVGAFVLSLSVHDILNQTRSLTHTVNSNYMEDSYKLVLGRFVLFGVKWNFGKMNASHNQKAQDALWNMVY